MAKEKTYLTVKTKSKTLLLDAKIKPTAEELALIPMYIAGGYHTRYKKEEKASNVERGKNLKAMMEARKKAEKAEADANEISRKLIDIEDESEIEALKAKEAELREIAKKAKAKAEKHKALLEKKESEEKTDK